MKAIKPVTFFLLCALYGVAVYFLIQHAVLRPTEDEDTLGYTMRNLIGGCLLATYLVFLLLRFLVGKVAVEYLVIMPVLTLIASFLIGAVLHIFGFDISRNAFEQAGIVHLVFSLAVALRMWRHYWLPGKHSNPDETA